MSTTFQLADHTRDGYSGKRGILSTCGEYYAFPEFRTRLLELKEQRWTDIKTEDARHHQELETALDYYHQGLQAPLTLDQMDANHTQFIQEIKERYRLLEQQAHEAFGVLPIDHLENVLAEGATAAHYVEEQSLPYKKEAELRRQEDGTWTLAITIERTAIPEGDLLDTLHEHAVSIFTWQTNERGNEGQ